MSFDNKKNSKQSHFMNPKSRLPTVMIFRADQIKYSFICPITLREDALTGHHAKYHEAYKSHWGLIGHCSLTVKGIAGGLQMDPKPDARSLLELTHSLFVPGLSF